MGWLIVLAIVAIGAVGMWALFRVDDTEGSGGALLGGDRTLKELPPPPPLPGYRPAPPPPASEPHYVEIPEALAGFVPASIGKRFLARLIDSLFIGLFTMFIGVFVSLGAFRGRSLGSASVVLVVAILFFTAFYEIAFIAVLGQTPGKMFMGIRVVSSIDGLVPTVAQAAVRWGLPSLVAYLPRILPGSDSVRARWGAFSALLSLLIYLWALWDPRKQGLHDKVAMTLVQRFR